MAVEAMGLSFANPLGLAAGFDRRGTMIRRLARLGFGHIEIGTVTPGVQLGYSRPPARGPRIGVNIGSQRYGLDDNVIADYVTTLEAVFEKADYLVANLSSPFAGRHADTCGIERLIVHVKEAYEKCAAATGCRKPLLLKVQGGADGAPMPAAVSEAHRCGFDGVVLVSSSIRRIAAFADYLDHMALISVGGIVSADDMSVRLAAGAMLVQIYTSFLQFGPRCLGAFQRISVQPELNLYNSNMSNIRIRHA